MFIYGGIQNYLLVIIKDNKNKGENMYIGYIKDRQHLGFMCFKDIKDGKQITLIYITITIIINSSLFMSDLDHQSY